MERDSSCSNRLTEKDLKDELRIYPIFWQNVEDKGKYKVGGWGGTKPKVINWFRTVDTVMVNDDCQLVDFGCTKRHTYSWIFFERNTQGEKKYAQKKNFPKTICEIARHIQYSVL